MDIPPPSGPYAPPPQGQTGQQPGAPWVPPHGQVPYRQVPYRQWPGPYSPYSRPPVNGFAIASLVLGILCFVPAVGLVLGLVAFAQIKRKGERGKGLAIAGSILSVVGVLLLVLGVVTGGASAFMEGFREAARESRQGAGAFPVDKGGCFDAPDGKLDSMKYAFQVANVPCSGRHDGEVFAEFRVNHTRFPGEDAIAGLAETRCTDLQDDYVMDSWLDPGDAEIYFFMPDRATWRQGDRHVTCIFAAADREHPLKGSLRRDASTLDAHQLAYVKADRAFDKAYATAPEDELVENDLDGHKKWAARVDKGLAEQARQLRAHDWPAASRAHIDALVAEIGEGRKEWRKAAAASDADGFNEHQVAGVQRLGDKSAVAARKSLGLAVTSPRDATPEDGPESGLDEDHGGGGDAAV
ncbi:DUF4190 domain-containing protein [Streptomyces sp. NPDC058308]|uniref:DUF4190 domain-containing protein n=1 Tax=Streptomyces sp. NPDC058308 TaxID=3346440 RepID=UPI0036EEE89D